MRQAFGINTDTVWFRLALSAAAVWLLVAGYNAYSFYVGLKEAAATADQEYTQSQYDECSYDKLDFQKGQFSRRPSTFDEAQDCRHSVDKGRAYFEGKRPIWDKLWNERSALEHFFYRGLLPVGVLLLLVAFSAKLKAGGRFYVNWIKTGSRNKQP